MDLAALTLHLAALRSIIDENQCMICYESFDSENKIPMMICLEQHNCCSDCVIFLNKCPLCRAAVTDESIKKNRLLVGLLQEVEKAQRKVDLQQKLIELKSDSENFKKKRRVSSIMDCSERSTQIKVNKGKSFQIRKVQTSTGFRNKTNNPQSSLYIGR